MNISSILKKEDKTVKMFFKVDPRYKKLQTIKIKGRSLALNKFINKQLERLYKELKKKKVIIE